jgi:hypothetical protein
MRRVIDLSAHINEDKQVGNPANFPICLRPLRYEAKDDYMEPVPGRLVVVREDTAQPIAIVSERYSLVPHQRILDTLEKAVEPLQVGPVPRGIYVDRQGARMRALFKFPALTMPILDGNEVCPCIKLENSYDGTSRISIHIGAFRFVCTNLAVGGGGVFAGGFVSVHAGDIPIHEVGEQLAIYLRSFERIVELYRFWSELPARPEALVPIFQGVPQRHSEKIFEEMSRENSQTAYKAYNVATRYATHQMRSYRTAFDLLECVNRGFQKFFPPN